MTIAYISGNINKGDYVKMTTEIDKLKEQIKQLIYSNQCKDIDIEEAYEKGVAEGRIQILKENLIRENATVIDRQLETAVALLTLGTSSNSHIKDMNNA